MKKIILLFVFMLSVLYLNTGFSQMKWGYPSDLKIGYTFNQIAEEFKNNDIELNRLDKLIYVKFSNYDLAYIFNESYNCVSEYIICHSSYERDRLIGIFNKNYNIGKTNLWWFKKGHYTYSIFLGESDEGEEIFVISILGTW